MFLWVTLLMLLCEKTNPFFSSSICVMFVHIELVIKVTYVSVKNFRFVGIYLSIQVLLINPILISAVHSHLVYK